jgi:hypothetical protein
MKKIAILAVLLINTWVFAQEHHFKAERKEVTWQLAYKSSDAEILKLIDKNHTKVIVNYDNSTGKGVKLNCDCKGGGWYFEQAFDLDFEVEIKDSKYLVTVSSILFESESETNPKTPVENYFLRIGQNVFHPTEKNKINMMCLDAYLTKLFQIPNAEVTVW